MSLITTTIRGTEYKLVKLSPVIAGRLALRVGTLLAAAAQDGELIKSLIDAYKAHGEQVPAAGVAETLTDAPKLMQALAGGLANLNSDELWDIGMTCVRGQVFAAGTGKLHSDEAVDEHFGKHPDHMFLLMAWAIKENCAGFFGLGAKA